MAQVPYSGAPEVSPQLDALPTPHVAAPAEAFGVNVSGAISHLGEVAEGAGKELFSRAYAFQEMDEQIKADKAAADSADRMTQRYLEFDQLKGNERVAGFKQYQDDLDKIREDGAAELSSPYAKAQYLKDSRRSQFAMIWHGGALARQGQDEAAKATNIATRKSVIDNFDKVNPSDPAEFDGAVDKLKTAAVDEVHRQTGFAPGTEENTNVAKFQLSTDVRHLIDSKRLHDAAGAQKLLDRASDSGLLTDEDADALQGRIDRSLADKTAKKIGYTVGGDPKNRHLPPAELEDKIRKAAREEAPTSPDTEENAVRFGVIRNNADRSIERGEYRDTLGALTDIVSGKTTNGKVPLTPEEAEQDPNVRKLVDSIRDKPDLYKTYIDAIARNGGTEGWVANKRGTDEFVDLNQKLRAPNSPAEVDEALNANLLATHMTHEQRDSIRKLQETVIKNQSAKSVILEDAQTPEVQKALTDAGLTDKTSNEYKYFVNQLGEAVKAYSEGGKKTIGRPELGEIAQGMLKTMHTTGWFGARSADYVYNRPEDLAELSGVQKRAATIWKQMHNGNDPSDEQLKSMTTTLYSEYFRLLGEKSRPVPGKSTARAGSPAKPAEAELPIGGPR